jgi:hypothetical protein
MLKQLRQIMSRALGAPAGPRRRQRERPRFRPGIEGLEGRQVPAAIVVTTFAGAGPDVFGAFVSRGHNLIGHGTGSTGFVGDGDQVGTAEDPLDPRLAPLAFNGGRTMTHALLRGSLAIDRGDNAGVPGIDQRGLARRKDGDRVPVVDIGAF